MTKLRIVNGVPEVEGEPSEIAELIRRLGTMNSHPIQSAANPQLIPVPQDKPPLEIRKQEEIVKAIEENGKPFSFSMAELQKKFYGRVITPKADRETYEKFYRECKKAMGALKGKHGGKWDTESITVDGSVVRKYTLIEETEEEEHKTQYPIDQFVSND